MQKTFLFIFCLALAFPVFGQTAAEVDAILSADTVSAAVLARFALGAADLLPPELSGPDAEKAAYDMALQKGWITIPENKNATLKDTAFIIMCAFDLKGGLLYTWFKSPRYAYREMLYLKLIWGHADEAMPVTGQRLLMILDKTVSYADRQGGEK